MKRYFDEVDENLSPVKLKVRQKVNSYARIPHEDAQLMKSRRRSNCRGKIRYTEHATAQKALERYMSQIIFSSMEIYWCGRHTCYHLGHNKRMLRSTIEFREAELARNLTTMTMATPGSYY